MECGQYSQVDQHHGTYHHHEAAEGGVEVDDAEQDGGAGHRVYPVQPIAVQLILVQQRAPLGVHLDVGVGRVLFRGRGWGRGGVRTHRGRVIGRGWLLMGRG